MRIVLEPEIGTLRLTRRGLETGLRTDS